MAERIITTGMRTDQDELVCWLMKNPTYTESLEYDFMTWRSPVKFNVNCVTETAWYFSGVKRLMIKRYFNGYLTQVVGVPPWSN